MFVSHWEYSVVPWKARCDLGVPCQCWSMPKLINAKADQCHHKRKRLYILSYVQRRVGRSLWICRHYSLWQEHIDKKNWMAPCTEPTIVGRMFITPHERKLGFAIGPAYCEIYFRERSSLGYWQRPTKPFCDHIHIIYRQLWKNIQFLYFCNDYYWLLSK